MMNDDHEMTYALLWLVLANVSENQAMALFSGFMTLYISGGLFLPLLSKTFRMAFEKWGKK